MKAPDKIYVPMHNVEAETISQLDEYIVEGSVEYIRKDVLLKKVRKIAIWNTIKVGRKEIRDIVTEIINSL